MNKPYPVYSGVPLPETRGRKKGSVDRNVARQSAILKGVDLVDRGHSGVEAARMVHDDYPSTSPERMVRLIRQARKDNHQKQSSRCIQPKTDNS